MGAWGARAFDNDSACDWASDMVEQVEDLSLVESAFSELEEVGNDYLDADIAGNALAACEVVARLLGNAGYRDAYTEEVDLWVAAHPVTPSPALVGRALAAIDRILDAESELRELWEEGDASEWMDAMSDLRERVGGAQ